MENSTYLGLEGGITHSDPQSVTSALVAHWLPVFTATATDTALAETFLDEVRDGLSFNWSEARPNTTSSFERSIRSSRFDTGPGEDGIPYSGYHPISRLASRVFSSVSRRIVSDEEVPDRHNYTVLNFPPKKLSVFNDLGALVPPEQTRPIGKKNSSNKIVSKTWAWNFNPVFVLWISWIQKGFVPGRNFLINVLELDLFSRIFPTPHVFPCPRPF